MSMEKVGDKSVEQKIKECKELIIQNMEKTLQNKMVYMFLKDKKREADVKNYSVNSKDGIIKIEFLDHEKAMAFYNENNFKEKILIRPFNIYFSLQLTDSEMKKYYLEGITQDNQRQLFEIARQSVGVCKLYTSYANSSSSKAKLKSTGLLSFIRREPLEETTFKGLTEKLAKIGIKIFNYIHEKGMKVSLNLLDYLADELSNMEENRIQETAENKAKEIISQFGGNPNVQHVSVFFKKKEVPLDPSKPENKVTKLKTSALFELDTTEITYEVYEKVRIGIIGRKYGKVKLFFHNEENNSFLSLITQGLEKPKEQSEKQFEESLIKGFREINPNVLQVNVFPVKFNSTYFGRVYLKSQEEGKAFLVDYAHHRSKIYKFFKEKNISFNISIDTKTLRKIKAAERKARETEEKIKKQSQASKRDNRRGAPDNRIGLPPVVGQGHFGPPPLMPPSQQPYMGTMISGLPRMPDPSMMAMPPHMPKGVPPGVSPANVMMAPNTSVPPPQARDKISNLIRDKDRILGMDENQAKRILLDNLKTLAEEQGWAPGHEAKPILSNLLKNESVADTYRFLENQELFKDAFNREKRNLN